MPRVPRSSWIVYGALPPEITPHKDDRPQCEIKAQDFCCLPDTQQEGGFVNHVIHRWCCSARKVAEETPEFVGSSLILRNIERIYESSHRYFHFLRTGETKRRRTHCGWDFRRADQLFNSWCIRREDRFCPVHCRRTAGYGKSR